MDASNPAALDTILQPGDVIYMLAGGALPDAGQANPRLQLDQTVGGALSLLDACCRASVGRVIFASSGGTVYGPHLRLPIDESHPTEPISAYGVQKLAVEKYLAVYRKLHGLDSIVTRIANPFGPRQDPFKGQGLIAALAYKALHGDPIEVWGDGEVVRDYVFVEDLADALAGLADYRGPMTLFNIGTGVGVSVNRVIEMLSGHFGKSSLKLVYRPSRAFDIPVNVLAIDRIYSEIGWRPRTSFDDGVRRQIAWLQQSGLRRPGGGAAGAG